MRPIPPVPTFAVVGQPNEGKTTVMATLAENDAAAISPIPGTTTTCQRYPVLLDGQEVLVFWDTPGFENTSEVLQWFRAHEAEGGSLAQRFRDEFLPSARYPEECEIFKPLAEGAAIIYVVDASRPVRAVDRQQVEILRLCGNARIGVINSKQDESFLAEWQELMARDFNHRHLFNAHRATFRDRLHLLEAVRYVIPEWTAPMDRTLQALRDDWDSRLEQLADLLLAALRDLMRLRARETIQRPGDEPRARQKAADAAREQIRRLEQKTRQRILRLFRHSADHWLLEELLEADIFSEEVWRLLGLTKTQLIAAGAVAGAVAGGAIDVLAGGTSLLLGAAIGAAGGAATTWMSLGKAIHVELPRIPFSPFQGGKAGGIQAQARVDPRSEIVWILFDRLLLYIQLASSWSHGRRSEEKAAPISAGSKIGITSHWSRDDRAKISLYLGHLARPKPDPQKTAQTEESLRPLLLEKIRSLTSAREVRSRE